MTGMDGDFDGNGSDHSAQLAAELKHLLFRADALGMTLVSIHLENALGALGHEPDDISAE